QVTLDGIVQPKGRYQLPHQLITILETRGQGHTLNLSSSAHTVNPLVYTYRLEKPNDTELKVGVGANFTAPEGLSDDHASMAANMQYNWDNVPVEKLHDYAEVFDHFADVTTIDEYRRALTELANDAKLG